MPQQPALLQRTLLFQQSIRYYPYHPNYPTFSSHISPFAPSCVSRHDHLALKRNAQPLPGEVKHPLSQFKSEFSPADYLKLSSPTLNLLPRLRLRQYQLVLQCLKANRPVPTHLNPPNLTRVPSHGPVKHLTSPRKKTGGRNDTGRITTRHVGGGERRRLRHVDTKRVAVKSISQVDESLDIATDSGPGSDANTSSPMTTKSTATNKLTRTVVATPQRVIRIENDPNRSAKLALVQSIDTTQKLSYIIPPAGLAAGDLLTNDGTPALGNMVPLANIPIGTQIYNIELRPGKGAQLVRAAGTSARVISHDTTGRYAIVQLPSTKTKKVLLSCTATIGAVNHPEWASRVLGKAGASRRKGIRPSVRGVAMNAVDHPHGGGKGGRSKGHHSQSPWGKICK